MVDLNATLYPHTCNLIAQTSTEEDGAQTFTDGATQTAVDCHLQYGGIRELARRVPGLIENDRLFVEWGATVTTQHVAEAFTRKSDSATISSTRRRIIRVTPYDGSHYECELETA